VAENRYGASPPETIRLRWEGGGQPDQFILQPKLYALAAGVSDYANDSLDLTYAAKDAKDFGAALERQSGGIYREVVVRILENPTSDELLDGLDWLRQEVTSKDIAVIFVSGHGANDPDGDYYYLTRNSDPERLRRTAVSSFDVKKTLSSLPSKVLAFVDTCHSGNIMGARRGEVANITGVINDLTAAENGVVVFASSTANSIHWKIPNGAMGPLPRPWWRVSTGPPTIPRTAASPSISLTCISASASRRSRETSRPPPRPSPRPFRISRSP
jgi:hypothetical protein